MAKFKDEDGGALKDNAQDVTLNSTAQRQLRSIVERVERLELDRAAVLDDLKELFAEAKGNGWDTKVIRKVVKLRKMDPGKRQEEEALVDLYEHAIGGPRKAQPAEDEDDDLA